MRIEFVEHLLHTWIVCCVELQKVSPRPGRTAVALGLRASSDLADHGDNRLDSLAPLAASRPTPRNRIGKREQALLMTAPVPVCRPLTVPEHPRDFDECPPLPVKEGLI